MELVPFQNRHLGGTFAKPTSHSRLIPLGGFFVGRPKDFARHPKGRDKYVHRIIKKCRLVAFDQVPEPSEGKRRGNQQ